MSNITITEDQIRTIISKSEIKTYKFGNKTTVVHAVLPNGFVMVESSSCVDPENFDEVIGYDICMNRIANKIWELEGYALQKKVAEDDKSEKI
jgi:hypothetical protein